jgi:uncharacterized protein (DUF433 family)
MSGNTLAELDRKLAPLSEGGELDPLESWRRSLRHSGEGYAQLVQTGARIILRNAVNLVDVWEVVRRDVQAGKADEIHQARDRLLRAFGERLANLREAHELMQAASRLVPTELPEAHQLVNAINELEPMLRRLTDQWKTREDLERLIAEDGGDRVVKTPGVCGGDARVRGTRITVYGLEEWRRLGWADQRILDAYPQLNPEDLAAAWDYVNRHADEIHEAIRENQEA